MLLSRPIATLLAALCVASVPATQAEAEALPKAPAARASTVEVAATVPTLARARVGDARVSTRIARPVRLERRSADTWSLVRTSRTDRRGKVAFALPTPTAATTYRVTAPARKVVLRKRVHGQVTRRAVRLAAWVGPTRVVAGPAPISPPAQERPQDPPRQQPQQPPEEQPQQPTATTELVRVRGDGTEFIGAGSGEVSADGRWVAFDTNQAVLPEDANSNWDVYLHDRQTGTTVVVSRLASGAAAGGTSYGPRISANGRFVVFQSYSEDLAAGDTNETSDVYVFDRTTGAVELVSRTATEVGSWYSGSPDVSADGRYVVFETMADNLRPDTPHGDLQVVRVDRQTGDIDAVSWPSLDPSSGSSAGAAVSDDGQRVVFTSEASDLVARDDNGASDVFVMDLESWTVRAVSRTAARTTGGGASYAARISGDGSTVVYSSDAYDLVSDDDNDVTDVFRYDVASRSTTLVSRTPQGRPGNAKSYGADVSGDGTAVGFVSIATDLAPGSRLAQVYLAEAGRPELVSVGLDGRSGDAGATYPSLGADGRVVAFTSASSNLVPGTVDTVNRVYVRLRP